MTSDRQDPVEKLKIALAEVRENRAYFSDESFSTIVMALLDHIRRLQITANTTGATTDEIRLVTVIFIDVKDSTLLAQAMDTGDFKSVLEESHRRISSLITEWDGTIGQYLGDGVLAFFGAQKSRGDDALRCVACALAIQNAMNDYGNEVFLNHGVEFAVRIGISTGRLVVGMVGGADKQELLALGPATNLAARLQTEAPAGGIYIDSATSSRVRSQFNLKSRPMMRIKGFDEPILIYEVLGRNENRNAQLAQTMLASLPVPLVGREDVLTDIAAEMLSALQDNALHVVTMVGEIGMGKSHILQESSDKLDLDRFIRIQMVAQYELRTKSYNLLKDFLVKYCGLTGAMTPLSITQQIVQHIRNTWDDPNAGNVAEMLGFMAGYGFEDSSFVRSLFVGNDMSALVAARWIGKFLRGVSNQTRTPIVFIVDNLQWADPESVTLLEMLVQELSDLPFTLLIGTRPTYQSQFANYMAQVQRHRTIMLDRLSNETTRRMIETILKPIERVPNNVISLIVERAEGNPLFVMEFLAMLFDSGVFHKGRDGRWRFNLVLYDSTYKKLPAGLIEVVQSRLDDLAPDIRLILQLGAVIGQTFWKDIVDEIAGRDQSLALDILAIRGIITLDPESAFENELQYSFRHLLYRDVAYEMLPRAKREGYHRLVSKWLISRIAGKPDYFAILADQFEAGGEQEAALFTYLEAAQNRLQRGMLNDCLKMIERALAMARNLPREVAIGVSVQVWTLQAQALNGLGRFSEATASAQSALRLFNEMPLEFLSVVKVNAARLLAVAYTALGDYSQADDSLGLAQGWTDENDHAQMAAVLRAYGILNLHRGKLDEARHYEERSLTFARNTQQDAHITATLAAQGMIALEQGCIGEALACFEECLEINTRNSFAHYQSTDLRNIGIVYMNLHQFDRAKTVLETAADLRKQLDEVDTLLLSQLAYCRMILGEGHEMLQELRRLMTFSHRDVYVQFQVRLTLIDGHLWQQDAPLAGQLIQQLLAEVQTVNALYHARTLLRLGRVKLLQNEPDAAATLKQAVQLEQQLGGREVWMGGVWLAEAGLIEGDIITADKIAEIALGLAFKPDLRYAFLHAPTVEMVLHRTEKTD